MEQYRGEISNIKSHISRGNINNALNWIISQVSDDEDDTHPNIDTPSLFKWRHEARVQRMEEMDAKKKAVSEEKKK